MSAHPIRVLLVGDDAAEAERLRDALNAAGPTAMEVSTAVPALPADATSPHAADASVVILDVGPHADRIPDALAQAAARWPEAALIALVDEAHEKSGLGVLHAGAHDYLVRGRGERELVVRAVRYAIERKRSEHDLRSSFERLARMLEGAVGAMAAAVEMRDPYTAGHQRRVARLAREIAQAMDLPEQQCRSIHVAATVHDVGKIVLPAEILSKPRALTDIEFALVQVHSRVGSEILAPIDFPWPIADMVLQHHERMDGSGYPDRLDGDRILLEARILCVADVVEAMASHRPYRPALGWEAALRELTSNAERKYDPEVVGACVALFREKGFRFEQPSRW